MQLRVLFPLLFALTGVLLGIKLYTFTEPNDVDRIITGSVKTQKMPTRKADDKLKIAFENMSALDAAKLFNTLEINDLTLIALTLNPTYLGDILPLMQSDKAEKLMRAMLKKK